LAIVDATPVDSLIGVNRDHSAAIFAKIPEVVSAAVIGFEEQPLIQIRE
jgi:hypothetical protein